MSRLTGTPMPGDEVFACHECGGHEFVSEGVDSVDGHFYCNECASKEE